MQTSATLALAAPDRPTADFFFFLMALLVRTLRTVARTAPSRLSQRRLCSRGVPQNFGARDGQSITNKVTVLQEVDEALGLDRPPDLEVLLTDHLTCTDSRPVSYTHLTLPTKA